VAVISAASSYGMLRRTWLLATITCTLGAFAVTIALAPTGSTSPTEGLRWLLFVGSSVHVASTAWFFTLPEVRAHARGHPARYLLAPLLLVLVGAAVAAATPTHVLTWLLVAFFGWQFWHFQKQNLGMAALAAISSGGQRLSEAERRALKVAGAAGVLGLLAHPRLLELDAQAVDWAFAVAAVGFAAAVTYGVRRLALRRATAGFGAVYLSSLLFFAPVFVFSNPYAAVAGLVMAHGGQYLVLVGLIAGADRPDRTRVVGLALLVNVALLGGLALNAASHLHTGGPAARAVYGCYLGLTMAHFVIDAGLWRLRDEFPRSLLAATVPYLLGQPPPQPPAAPDAGPMANTRTNAAMATSTRTSGHQ
jgi:hypothetical protein